MCVVKETEHLQRILAMVCICTFLAYHLEMLPKRCLSCTSSREAMLQSGTGFKSTSPKRYRQRKRISEFIVDETLIKVGSDFIWLWAATEPENRKILALTISKERNMFVAERFISGLVKAHGRRPVSTDGGTWYPPACRFLKLTHHIHSPFEKSVIERTIQYVKDRTECFDDYFPCRIAGCSLRHVTKWFDLFAEMHNNAIHA